ncbi:hypothetical protein J6590_050129 [Homalodisca vitripennis]|nr:hypothetical protein J6590_050129 [Homalodisca vitripennis]
MFRDSARSRSVYVTPGRVIAVVLQRFPLAYRVPSPSRRQATDVKDGKGGSAVYSTRENFRVLLDPEIGLADGYSVTLWKDQVQAQGRRGDNDLLEAVAVVESEIDEDYRPVFFSRVRFQQQRVRNPSVITALRTFSTNWSALRSPRDVFVQKRVGLGSLSGVPSGPPEWLPWPPPARAAAAATATHCHSGRTRHCNNHRHFVSVWNETYVIQSFPDVGVFREDPVPRYEPRAIAKYRLAQNGIKVREPLHKWV